jgi:hypothetical protein
LQAITFLSDGGDNVRDLQLYLSPHSEHLLDWFHITMRITVLRQQLKELITVAPDHDLEQLADELERVKWYLWHGNVFRALQVLEGVQWELEDLDEEVPTSRKLARAVAEFHTYITANESFIPNYGDRHRYGEVISTAFVESTVKWGDQQAVCQETADALDQEGGAPAPAGQIPGAERGSAVNLRALVSRDAQHRRFSSTGGVIAPTLKWSRLHRPPGAQRHRWQSVRVRRPIHWTSALFWLGSVRRPLPANATSVYLLSAIPQQDAQTTHLDTVPPYQL